MRVLLCCLAIAVGCEPREGNERLDAGANPNLTVEPITIDAGTPPRAPVKRASIGDHRRREEDDAKERRREKPRPQPEPEVQREDPDADRREAERREAERRRLTETPLEVAPPRW